MKFLYKMERKLGKFAIPHLMRYILAIYCIGFILEKISYNAIQNGLMTNTIYNTWLSLDIDMLLKGQVWRLFTFIIAPPEGGLIGLVFFLLLYYMIGEALESALGTFFLNIYFFSGMLLNILGTVLLYVVTKVAYGQGISVSMGIDSINGSMFLLFALLFPNMPLLLGLIIPVKAKWLGIIYGCVMGYGVLSAIKMGLFEGNILALAQAAAIIISLLNFLIFFFATRNYKKYSYKELKRRNDFAKSINRAKRETGQAKGFTTISRHKCAICGRTERDDDTLEFRFCSKCNGNYEYCSDHLYTHVHVNAYPGSGAAENIGFSGEGADKSAENKNDIN